MSTGERDGTRVFRHAIPGYVLCGAALRRAGTRRRRLSCGGACRQRAYRLRDEARRPRGAEGRAADPVEVTRLLAAVLGRAGRR